MLQLGENQDLKIHYDNYEDELIEDYDTFFTRNLGLNTSLIAHIVVSKDRFLESCSQSAPVGWTVSNINIFLRSAGVPKKSLLTTDEFVLTIVAIALTLIVYYFVMGKRHVQKRKMLAENLKIAQAQVRSNTILLLHLFLWEGNSCTSNTFERKKIESFFFVVV